MSNEERQSLVSTGEVEKLMLNIRGKDVLLDRDVAMLYGVETKHINQALKNNPEKFPAGYVFELDKFETKQLIDRRDNFAVKNFDRKIEQNKSTERISSGNCPAPWNHFRLQKTVVNNRRGFCRRQERFWQT